MDYIREHKAQLFSQFHLSKIGLFGSFARDEQTVDSDIDLIVEFEPGTEDLFHLKLAMKQFFREVFQKEVDICREKFIKPYYKHRILKDAIFV